MTRKIKSASRGTQLLALLGIAVFVLASAVQSANESNSTSEEQGNSDDRVKQGKYLVHHVAMCVKCHTPKNQKGEMIETQLLQGARIPVENPYPQQEWALKAPKLAGLPGGWSQQDVAIFLETGKTPFGHDVRPPMPPFRMKKQDAEAVAAYLQSLGSD